jgi:hypothetical protein
VAALRCIVLRRTGGLAGMRLEVTVDLRSDPASAGGLAELLRDVDVVALTRRAASGTQVADGYHYDVILVAEGGREELSFADAAMPAELRPVIRVLERRALDELRARRRAAGSG